MYLLHLFPSAEYYYDGGHSVVLSLPIQIIGSNFGIGLGSMLTKHSRCFLFAVITQLDMLEVDFSPWEEGPPIQDECSQAEGLAYSEAVRQLQEKSQRGLSKELVKQWGAHFKDKVRLGGVVCRKAMNSVLEL